MGRKHSGDTRAKIRVTMMGKKMSKATKIRMALREVRKKENIQVARKHYLEVHQMIPHLDQRKIYISCHICGKVFVGVGKKNS